MATRNQERVSQFAAPRGPLGHAAGWLMARLNDEMNRLVIDLLDVRSEESVLEIGSGPGRALAYAAARAAKGFVAGVDVSDVMVAQARRRNRVAVREERLGLRRASVSALPYADARFDKALAINSYYFWPRPEADLREVRRVLKPGGMLALAVRAQDPSRGAMYNRKSLSEEQIAAIGHTLARAGYELTTTKRARLRFSTAVVLLARKPE